MADEAGRKAGEVFARQRHKRMQSRPKNPERTKVASRQIRAKRKHGKSALISKANLRSS